MSPKELVLAQFPGRVQIPLIEAGLAIGIKKQTSYNMNSAGTFPLPIRRVGAGTGKPMVALSDLITYLEQQNDDADQIKVSPPAEPNTPPVIEHIPDTPPKRGRPTKREQRERAARLARWDADN